MEKLNHLGTKTLESERLILCTFKESDYQAMYDNWASNENVARYMTWKKHESPEVTKTLCKEWEDKSKADNYYNWIVIVKSENKPIGTISVVNINDSINEAVIGYSYSEEYWGQGYGTESFKTVIDFLFGEVGFNRITAFHHKDNIGSGRVMQKSGLKYEGSYRQSALDNNGNLYDLCNYAIIKSDWCEMRK